MIRTFSPENQYSWNWLTLTGPDAQDFLHRMTTADVRGLEVGQGSAGCFLNAQGKVRATFTLWRYGQTEFAFELDAGREGRWKAELLAAIDQYTFAEKMTLADVSGLAKLASLECRWIFGQPGGQTGSEAELLSRIGASALASLVPMSTVAIDEEIRLCHQGSRQFGRPWITAWGRPGRVSQWLERTLPEAAVAGPELLEDWRIEALRPRTDFEITDATIPLEAGMTDAISANKGCYPGQEVIEKIVSLGAPAKRLALLEGTLGDNGKIPEPGETIQNAAEPPADIGQVTSVSASGTGKFRALGYLRKIHAKEGLEVRFSAGKSRGTVIRIAPYADA